jgi:hypothetical protein
MQLVKSCSVGDALVIMSVPTSKRRKIEHVSSEVEGDDASFASFSESTNGSDEQHTPGIADQLDANNESLNDEDDEPPSEGDSDSSEAQVKTLPNTSTIQAKLSSILPSLKRRSSAFSPQNVRNEAASALSSAEGP